MTTAKSLSQIALALVVGSSAVFFTACGADSSKAPKIGADRDRGVIGFSRNDDTVIKEINVYGRDGKCAIKPIKIHKSGMLCEEYKGEKITYDKIFGTDFEGKCEPKNGKFQIEVKTNFGTYAYEGKENAEATLK